MAKPIVGQNLASPLSLLPVAIEGEKGRIIVTRIGSLSTGVVEGLTFSRGSELPSPTWCESINLSKEKDPLLEDLWHTSFDEESPIEMTSRSTRI